MIVQRKAMQEPTASGLEARATRRSILTFAASVGALVTLPRSAAAATRRAVVLQPLGPGSEVLTQFAERALRAFYAVELSVAPVQPLPKRAYYPPRNRYRAEKLLDELTLAHPDAFRVLGLTAVDISTTKGQYADFGILGLASIDGRACVLSSFRCRRSAKNEDHAIERLGKTAVHELGHTFGLEHCPNRGCLMEDGKGTVLTTDGEYDLCADCRRQVAARDLLAVGGTIPWAKA